jgi:hypothetical protein
MSGTDPDERDYGELHDAEEFSDRFARMIDDAADGLADEHGASKRDSAKAAWAWCIARSTRGSTAPSPSNSCLKR